eukprot:PhF_6_TR28840/c0_g1_i1/m.42199
MSQPCKHFETGRTSQCCKHCNFTIREHHHHQNQETNNNNSTNTTQYVYVYPSTTTAPFPSAPLATMVNSSSSHRPFKCEECLSTVSTIDCRDCGKLLCHMCCVRLHASGKYAMHTRLHPIVTAPAMVVDPSITTSTEEKKTRSPQRPMPQTPPYTAMRIGSHVLEGLKKLADTRRQALSPSPKKIGRKSVSPRTPTTKNATQRMLSSPSRTAGGQKKSASPAARNTTPLRSPQIGESPQGGGSALDLPSEIERIRKENATRRLQWNTSKMYNFA